MNDGCLMRSILDLSGEDDIELFLADQAIMVGIGPCDQFLKLLFGNVFSEFLCDSSEVLDGDEAGAFIVVECEDRVDVGSGIPVAGALGQQGKPFFEVH